MRRPVHLSVLIIVALTAAAMTACATPNALSPAAAGGTPAPTGPDSPVSAGDPVPRSSTLVATVSGVVRDRAGRSVANVTVEPVSLDVPAVAIPELAVLTDTNGRFRWTLLPGRYSFSALAAGRSGPSREVTVKAGQAATLDLALG